VRAYIDESVPMAAHGLDVIAGVVVRPEQAEPVRDVLRRELRHQRQSMYGAWRKAPTGSRRPSASAPELRERAVRMIAEVRPDYGSQWSAICAVSGKLGIGSAETLRTWVRRAEVDAAYRRGLTSDQAAEVTR